MTIDLITPPPPPGTTQPGLYQHKNGDLYVVEGVINEASNENEDTYDTRFKVLYWPVNGGSSKKKCRWEDEFHEWVEWPDGQNRPRFRPVTFMAPL